MFFFPKDEEKFGELVKSVSFFDFFKVKLEFFLQVNLLLIPGKVDTEYKFWL